jgi:hypothetical protein
MSRVIVSDHATVFEGQDAILLVKALTLRGALRLAEKKIRISRHVGPTKLLEAAGQITHKKYKRGAYASAIDDLTQWIAAMKAALPIEKE